MRYLIEPIERGYVKGYGFLSYAKVAKLAKNLNNKYGQKLADSAKKSTTDALKIAGKRSIQKTVEAAADFVGNTTAKKIKSISTELHSKNPASEPNSNDISNEIPKEKYISLQERQKIIDELRLI